jgi:hypothetical protein
MVMKKWKGAEVIRTASKLAELGGCEGKKSWLLMEEGLRGGGDAFWK